MVAFRFIETASGQVKMVFAKNLPAAAERDSDLAKCKTEPYTTRITPKAAGLHETALAAFDLRKGNDTEKIFTGIDQAWW